MAAIAGRDGDMVEERQWNGLVAEIENAGLISSGHFAYRSGMHSLRLLDRDRMLSDTHIASRLGYVLAKRFFLVRSDVVATPSIWGAGLAQWVSYFLEPRRPVIYARNSDHKFTFTPGTESIEGKRVLVIDNLILTGSTMQGFVQAITRAGGTPVAVGTLANLSGMDFPIEVVGILNDELEIFDPAQHPNKASGVPVTEVGY
jgi:orotate phosphoribosyltransferase